MNIKYLNLYQNSKYVIKLSTKQCTFTFQCIVYYILQLINVYRFQRYTESKSCKLAACLIPKFKLNWVDPDKRNDIKEALYEYVSEQFVEKTQNSNIPLNSTPSSTIQNVGNYFDENAEDDFFSFNNTVISNNDNDIKVIINDYLTNNNIKSINDLPNI